MHPHDYTLLREREAANRLGMSIRTLQKWRLRGEGPPFHVVGRRAIRYSPAELQEFIAAGMRRSTSDPGHSEPQHTVATNRRPEIDPVAIGRAAAAEVAAKYAAPAAGRVATKT